MLFTDSDLLTTSDLLSVDPEIQTVIASASKPGQPALILEGQNGVIRQAWSECRAKLESSLAAFSTFVGVAGMQAHIGAVLNTGGWYGGNGTRPRLRLQQVVVGDTFYSNSISPLQRWVTYSALMLLFQTMANRLDSKDKQGDRYEKKRAFYEQERRRWWSMVCSQGLPFLMGGYLSRPGATHDYNPGVWDNTALSLTPGETVWTTPQQINLAITYVDTTAYYSATNRNNGESAGSDALSMLVPPNQQLTVSIASLNPPNVDNPPDVGISQGVAPMRGATGWNIYTGVGNGPLYLQNTFPIPIVTTSYTLLEFRFSGPVMGLGQHPDGGGQALFGNVIQRG